MNLAEIMHDEMTYSFEVPVSQTSVMQVPQTVCHVDKLLGAIGESSKLHFADYNIPNEGD